MMEEFQVKLMGVQSENVVMKESHSVVVQVTPVTLEGTNVTTQYHP